MQSSMSLSTQHSTHACTHSWTVWCEAATDAAHKQHTVLSLCLLQALPGFQKQMHLLTLW